MEYPPAIRELLTEDRLSELGPGLPNRAMQMALTAMDVDKTFTPLNVRDRSAALACLAGLWLHHDFLDESHAISQDLSGPDGSYWHAVMHRREGDFGNSKYWLRRVGEHAIFEPLRAQASLLADGVDGAEKLTRPERWDPFAFVDLCEATVRREDGLTILCRSVQRAEWDLLFDHCLRAAVS